MNAPGRRRNGEIDGNLSTMKTTIDRAGRLVVPKKIREAAGIVPGAELSIRVADGRIEIEPIPLQVRFVKRGQLTVAVPQEGALPPLTREIVKRTLSEVRRRGSSGRTDENR
jgi:AbrB family looped-hinge helix DNA binding protein